MKARIAPAPAPFPPAMQTALDAVMRGKPPLLLFTILARDPRLFQKFFAGGLLDRGNLTPRQREIVIDRTTALCGSEYEWGVHVAVYAEHVGFNSAHIVSMVHGDASDPCWSPDEKLLLRFCDQLHGGCNIDEDLWNGLHAAFSEEAILELLMLAGFYRTVSYLTNVLQLPLEPNSARFPDAQAT